LKVIYGNEKNPSRVLEIYKRLLELKQEDKSVVEFYEELKGLIDELEMHQPVVTDAATLREYRQNLTVSKFLCGMSLHSDPRYMMRYWEEIVFSR